MVGDLVGVEVGVANERLGHERPKEQHAEGEPEAVLADKSLHRAISPIRMYNDSPATISSR